MDKEVILTGLRSNSEFHLGNYLGAILPMVGLQQKYAGKYRLNMFIPDLHSITTPIDNNSLYEQTLRNLEVFVAAGLNLDDSDTFIYRQSYIPAHSELTWILDCFSYFGELSRMTEFKDKSQDQTNVSVGLFNYPVLMAADILLYDAKWVPVGEDQRQHIELTRDIAVRMNNKFGEMFTVPHEWQKQLEFTGNTRGIRIRSLKNPDKKMSKSVQDPAGTILLSDNPDDAAKKILSATTDSIGSINYDFDKQPGVTNLLQILSLMSGLSQAEVNQRWEGKSSYGELKQAAADAVRQFLTEFQEKLSHVDRQKISGKLAASEAEMNGVAGNKLSRVQKAVGLRPKI